MLKYSHSETTG